MGAALGGEAEIASDCGAAALPGVAARYIAGVLLAACGCLSPLVAPGAGWLGGPVEWPRVVLLALLHACWEPIAQGLPVPLFRFVRRFVRRLVRGRPTPPRAGLGPQLPPSAGAFFPVLFAGVLMLPPAAAALVAVPAALVGSAAPPRALRRAWNAAQLALAGFTAAVLFHLLDGPRLLLGCRFPAAILPSSAAVLVFCLVNIGLVAAMRVLAERRRAAEVLRALLPAAGLPALPHAAGGLMVAVLWQGRYGAFAALLALLPLSVCAWVFAQGRREPIAHQATVQALVQAVEIKDAYTRGHSERVGRAAVLIAQQLGMAEERLRTLHFAGTLHDVGKLGVATELLRRNGPLTEAERRAVEVHPVFGHELVRDLDFLGEARSGILHHHERMDGRGYPDGLVGEQIPEFARIISVADAFDSMTSTRCYRRGRPVAEAIAELRRCSGSQFDPAMVRALVAAVELHGWRAEPAPDGPEGPDGSNAAEAVEVPIGVPGGRV